MRIYLLHDVQQPWITRPPKHLIVILLERIRLTSNSRYEIVRLLLGGVDCFVYGPSLTSERRRGTSIEEESNRRRLDLRAEPCSAYRDSDMFLRKGNKRRLGIEIGE